MSLTSWIIIYVVNIIFWSWIFFLKGAEMLGDTPFSGVFTFLFTLKWREISSEGIKLFGVVILVFHTFFFLLGLGVPEFRAFWG